MSSAVSATSAVLRVDSPEAIKSHVVLQDLAIRASNVAPVKREQPRPAQREREANAMDPTPREGSRKRISKSDDALSPTSLKRRSGDGSPRTVRIEGQLGVSEKIQHGGAPFVRRSLGQLYCCLTEHSRTWVLEFVPSEGSTVLLDLEEMTLSHDASCEFSLRCGNAASLKVTAFHFSAATSEDCSRWVNELRDVTPCKNEESSNAERAQSSLNTSSQSEVSKERSERSQRGGFLYTMPPKTTHIILVRHGHYVNAHAKGISDADQVLSQMGRQQAELCGKYLEKLYHRTPARNQAVSIYHSDLTRAVETATVIAKNFSGSPTPISSCLLREGWPGQPFTTNEMPPQLRRERTEDEQELDRQDSARMEEAFDKFFAEVVDGDEGSFRVIVCHANLIRYLLCRALRIEPHAVWGHFEINHCGITRIDICRNRPLKVMTVNETGHLPQSLTTSSEDHL